MPTMPVPLVEFISEVVAADGRDPPLTAQNRIYKAVTAGLIKTVMIGGRYFCERSPENYAAAAKILWPAKDGRGRWPRHRPASTPALRAALT